MGQDLSFQTPVEIFMGTNRFKQERNRLNLNPLKWSTLKSEDTTCYLTQLR